MLCTNVFCLIDEIVERERENKQSSMLLIDYRVRKYKLESIRAEVYDVKLESLQVRCKFEEDQALTGDDKQTSNNAISLPAH